MFGFLLFLHLTGLFIWLGAMFAIVVMLLLLKKQLGSDEANTLAKRIIRIFSLFAHPSSVLVLVSGIIMIVKLNIEAADRPLWLNLMEQGGMTIIMLAIIITGILGSKAKKRLNNAQGQRVSLSGYLNSLTGFMALILILILVVSMKIG